MARAAQSLTTLLGQINKRFPYRDKSSDGGIGDAAHAARKSDHNPVKGVYHARDFDHDPDANGLNCVTLYRELRASKDRRIKYIIFQRKIWYPTTGERNYTGVNAHLSHLHLSVQQGIGDTDSSPWHLPFLGGAVPISKPSTGGAPQTYGLSPTQVMTLQRTLNRWYPSLKPLAVDGDYGPATLERVRYFQQRAKLTVDGIAGPKTLSALGIK